MPVRNLAIASPNLRRSAFSLREKRSVATERTMKMATSPEQTDDELLPEYDFRSMRGVVRGKYANRYRDKLRVVRLAEDVAAAFPDEAAVNAALREYLRERGQPSADLGQGKV